MVEPLFVLMLTTAILVALASLALVLRGFLRDADDCDGNWQAEPMEEEGDRLDASPRGPLHLPSLDQRTSLSGTIACKHCGADNDPVYTYCQRCVTRL